MEQPPTRPESERLLSLATYFLRHRDLTNSREHALAAHRSDPKLSGPDQILAVTNVLLAADRRLPNHQLDWYSILQITRPGTRPEIEIRFRRLVSLLNPLQNKVPFSQDAFKLVCDAWSVLSDPEKKTQYDNEINNGNENLNGDNPQKAEKTQESGENEGKNESGGTFWTVCPYCYYMYMYEKVYEECCLRCQNCRRAFHGVAVEEGVTESVVVEGKEEYVCGFGFFPLGYKGGGVEFDGCGNNLGDKKAEFGDKSGGGGVDGGWDNVVEISDDSGEEKDVNVKSGVGVEEVKEEGVKGGGEKVGVRNDGKRVMKNVKSVPRNSKKIMGKGVKYRRTERVTGRRVRGVGKGDGGNGNGMRAGSGSGNGNGNGGGCFEDEMEFFEGDDDFFV